MKSLSVSIEVKVERLESGYILTFGRSYYPDAGDRAVAVDLVNIGKLVAERLRDLLNGAAEDEAKREAEQAEREAADKANADCPVPSISPQSAAL